MCVLADILLPMRVRPSDAAAPAKGVEDTPPSLVAENTFPNLLEEDASPFLLAADSSRHHRGEEDQKEADYSRKGVVEYQAS